VNGFDKHNASYLKLFAAVLLQKKDGALRPTAGCLAEGAFEYKK